MFFLLPWHEYRWIRTLRGEFLVPQAGWSGLIQQGLIENSENSGN